MQLEMVEGRILDRRKRFLADVELPGGERVVAHLANTGKMTGCWEPGAPCRLSHHPGRGRKLPWSVEQIHVGGWILVNSARPNQLVHEALLAGTLAELPFDHLRREAPFPDGGRVDFLLDGSCWVEVKNATLKRGQGVVFPDTVTARGLAHLEALQARIDAGDRGVLLLHVGHEHGASVAPARDLDPAWASFLGASSIEVLAYRVRLTADVMELTERVPFSLEPPAGGAAQEPSAASSS